MVDVTFLDNNKNTLLKQSDTYRVIQTKTELTKIVGGKLQQEFT